LAYRVIAVEDGAAALAELEDGLSVDLMLTDVALPGGLRGPELARRAHEQQPDLKVLFMSGYAGSSLEESDALDPQLLMAKPFRKRDLALRLRAALDETPQ